VTDVAPPEFPNPGGLVAEAIGFHDSSPKDVAGVNPGVDVVFDLAIDAGQTYPTNRVRAAGGDQPPPSLPAAPVDLGNL